MPLPPGKASLNDVRTLEFGPLNEIDAVASRLPNAVVSGRTAAWLHGIELPWKPIELTVPDGHCSGRAGVLLRRAALPKADIVTSHGFRATTPLRTVTDLGRKLKGAEGVIAIDMGLRQQLVSLDELESFLRRNHGAKGIARLRTAVRLADPKAESPMETKLRLLICRAGLPRPECQVELFDAAGRFLARTDLYYRDQRLAIEYDGGTHRESLVYDNRRQNRLLEAGYRLLRFTSEDFRNADGIVAQVATAIRVSARKPWVSAS